MVLLLDVNDLVRVARINTIVNSFLLSLSNGELATAGR